MQQGFESYFPLWSVSCGYHIVDMGRVLIFAPETHLNERKLFGPVSTRMRGSWLQ